MLIPADIRDEWDLVRPGLEEVYASTHPDWRPEDIYACCVMGACQLFLLGDTGGFIITQDKPQPFRSDKTLLVWIAHDKSGIAADTYIKQVEALAVDRGCVAVEFWSCRRGMNRLMSKHGYRMYSVVYMKEV
jgi:hypothetical protein